MSGRFQHEADQALRIDIENAEQVKRSALSIASDCNYRTSQLQEALKTCDHADTIELVTAGNYLTLAAATLRDIAKRPVSGRPRG